MSGEAQLEALLEMINTSARQAIAEYRKGGREVPTIHSKTLHPMDLAINTITLKKAVRLLEGACQQLCASLAPPQHTVCNYVVSFESACVDVVVRAKVADALEDYPNGLHVDELAKRVQLEKGKLARVLRLLATKGCFTEVEPNVFANNRISLATVSTSNSGAIARCMAEDATRGASVLYETMTKPVYAESYRPDMAPFIYALGKEGFKGSFFDLLNDPEKRENFHRAMIGFSFVMGSLCVLHHYPWNKVKTVCDIGAGIGAVSRPLSIMYPHLKIAQQDLPEVLVQAKDVWAKEAPETLQRNQIEFIPLNFLEKGPVQGQDVYYLRHIIHDWPDAEATIILKNIRNAMAPHSRLLIHDYILAHPCRDPNPNSINLHAAQEPMLPNFGNGNNRMYQMDLTMLIFFNSCERTLDHSIALASAAGLSLEKVYDLGETGMLEFRLATDNLQEPAIRLARL